MSIKEITIKDFSGGMQPSQRSNDPGSASLIKNFDIAKDNQKLTPRTGIEDWTTTQEKNIGIICIGSSDKGSEVVLGVGKALTNWYGVGWQYRTSLKLSDVNNVGGVDFGYLDLSILPQTFWDNVNADGSDVRLSNVNNEPIDFKLIRIDTTAQTGKVVFNGKTSDGAGILEYMNVYYGNADASLTSSAFTNIFGSGVYHAYPLDGDVVDYGSAADFNLDDGVAYTPSANGGFIGQGFSGIGELDTDNGGGNTGDETSFFGILTYAEHSTVVGNTLLFGTNDAALYIQETGIVRAIIDTDTNSPNTATSTLTLVPGTAYWIGFSYNDNGTLRIWVNGALWATNDNNGQDIDYDTLDTLYVGSLRSVNNIIEFVTTRRGSDKDDAQAEREGRMFFDNGFWDILGTDNVDTVAFAYDGVQIWQKTIGQDAWTEYLLNGAPVKNSAYYPIPAFVIEDSSILNTFVTDTEGDYTSSVNFFTELSTGDLNWTSDPYSPSDESLSRISYSVDKSYYFSSASGISNIAGGTLIPDVFSPYATVNDLTEYGQYLALFSDKGNKSYAQIWDLDSTLATAFPDFGFGRIRTGKTVSGALFGVLNNYLDNEDLANGRQSMDIRIWQGGDAAVPFLSFESPLTLEDPSAESWKQPVLNQSEYIENGFVFSAKIYDEDRELQEGLWSITKNEKNGRFAMSMFADTSALSDVEMIHRTGNVVLMTDGLGGVYKMSASDYSTPSVYKSVWFQGTDIDHEDQAVDIEVITEPLKEGQTITLEVRTQSQDWQTVFTHTETGSVRRQGKLIEASATNLPKFQEIQVRATSTGGSAGILGISLRFEDLMPE